VWQQLAGGHPLRQGTFDSDEAFAGSARDAHATWTRHAAPAATTLLPVDPAVGFDQVIEQLSRHGLVRQARRRWSRVVIEKPFGHDLASAEELNASSSVFQPHVGVPHRPLPRQGDGAEHVGAAVRQPDVRADLEQPLREPRPDHDGRGHRHRRPGGYYDGIGAARDVIQNHLLQLLALTAMEEPTTSSRPPKLRAEKEKVLAAARPPNP
jgi:glucose-6-phosphate 1-dehydrogenase